MIDRLIHNITVDLNIYDLQSIRLKQYNKNSQRLIISVTENNQPYFVDKNLVTCAFKMITPDDRAIYNDCVINDDGTISVDITENCCIRDGRGEAELDFIRLDDDYQLCTMNFHIIIEKSVYDNNKVIASPEFDILTKTIADNKKLNEQITENERIRNDNEDVRKQSETSRNDNENDRKQNEIARIVSENSRVQNEQERINSELDRKNSENLRNDAESIRSKNENDRISAETARDEAEILRQNAEVMRGSHINDNTVHITSTERINWNDKYSKSEIDNKFSTLETNIDWKESVNSFSDIAGTYPNPQDGWTVNTKDTDYTYRYNGNEWVIISANAIPKATTTVDGLLSKEDKLKLNSIINATAETPGLVKPDGTTITVDEDGTITGAASGFTGTADEVDQALENGDISEGMVVNITDDYDDNSVLATIDNNGLVPKGKWNENKVFGTDHEGNPKYKNIGNTFSLIHPTHAGWYRVFTAKSGTTGNVSEIYINRTWSNTAGESHIVRVCALINDNPNGFTENDPNLYIEELYSNTKNKAIDALRVTFSPEKVMSVDIHYNINLDNYIRCYVNGMESWTGYENTVEVSDSPENETILKSLTLSTKLNPIESAKNAYLLQGGTIIPESADLKSSVYDIPGNYYCDMDTVVKTLINCPVQDAFILKVESVSRPGDVSHKHFVQTFKSNTNKIIYRIHHISPSSDLWGPELTMATSSDITAFQTKINALETRLAALEVHAIVDSGYVAPTTASQEEES